MGKIMLPANWINCYSTISTFKVLRYGKTPAIKRSYTQHFKIAYFPPCVSLCVPKNQLAHSRSLPRSITLRVMRSVFYPFHSSIHFRWGTQHSLFHNNCRKVGVHFQINAINSPCHFFLVDFLWKVFILLFDGKLVNNSNSGIQVHAIFHSTVFTFDINENYVVTPALICKCENVATFPHVSSGFFFKFFSVFFLSTENYSNAYKHRDRDFWWNINWK